MPRQTVKFTPAEQDEFLSAFFNKLAPGSRPGFKVTAGVQNSFYLAAVVGGKACPVLVEYARGSAWPYPHKVSVNAMRKMAEEKWPDFLIRPCSGDFGFMRDKFGFDEDGMKRAVWEAVSRRINAKLATFMIVEGRGWSADYLSGRLECGASPSEAFLRAVT